MSENYYDRTFPTQKGVTVCDDGVAVKRPGQLTIALVKQHVDSIVTVTESDLEEALGLSGDRELNGTFHMAGLVAALETEGIDVRIERFAHIEEPLAAHNSCLRYEFRFSQSLENSSTPRRESLRHHRTSDDYV